MTELNRVSVSASSAGAPDFPATNAIDDDTTTIASTGSAETTAQWISVELPENASIDYVAIYNRNDNPSYVGWLSPYEIWLGNEAGARDFACNGGAPLIAPPEDGLGPFMTSCGGHSGAYLSVVWPAGHQRWGTIGELKAYSA